MPINAQEYLQFRLKPTLLRYTVLALKLSRRNTAVQTAIFLVTAANAAIGVAGLPEWMPAIVALSSAFYAVAEHQQLQVQLTSVNAAQLQLKNLLVWWESLSLVEQRLTECLTYLVESTEEAMHAELTWLRPVNKKKPSATAADGDDPEKAHG